MRGVLMLGLLLSACGVKDYLPAGPVLKDRERKAYENPAASGATYTGGPMVDFPVLPVQAWGAFYELDLVIESTHDRYLMHEYARVNTPDGPVWFAKDALASTKEQSVVAGLPNLETWVPELPITRKRSEVRVTDRSEGKMLDLEIRYENLEGEPVHVTYRGRDPRTTRTAFKRNRSTMGHSVNLFMAALDVPHMTFAKKATVNIDGRDYKVRKVLGLVGAKVALVQAQGGLGVGSILQAGTDDGFSTTWKVQGVDVTRDWTLTDRGAHLIATQADRFRSLHYQFHKGPGGALELTRMEVTQHAVDGPVTTIALQPALPDLRRPFDGVHTSAFVVDINGQPSKAIGRLHARWEGDQAVVELEPLDPDWVTDRPMKTTITYDEGQAAIEIERI